MSKIHIHPYQAHDIVSTAKKVMCIAINQDKLSRVDAESWDDVIRGAYRMARHFAYTNKDIDELNTCMLRWNARSDKEEWND